MKNKITEIEEELIDIKDAELALKEYEENGQANQLCIPKSAVEKKLVRYTGKAIADFNMIQTGDRVLVCLSGGKDSFAMLKILSILQKRSNNKFEIFVLTLNQGQPGWDDSKLREWLIASGIPFEILERDTYSIVKEKIPAGKTQCSLCSRLRRGVIYSYAKEHKFTKIALGHHREDLIESLLMAILYSGEIRSLPPKLITNDKKHIVFRPLVYCQEQDIIKYAEEQNFPIIPCGICSNQKNSMRANVKALFKALTAQNPKVPSNALHALQAIRTTQLMDKKLQDFKGLEDQLIVEDTNE
jgi:tRNA 2-thiocytidine biosynthesis protein TtcA